LWQFYEIVHFLIYGNLSLKALLCSNACKIRRITAVLSVKDVKQQLLTEQIRGHVDPLQNVQLRMRTSYA